MKKEDFERLKAVCEKEGFELEISSPWDQTYKISKKDIWDGVEFFKGADGIIRKISNIETFRVLPLFDRCNPSTESAYVEQLKKEAHERFGEIRHGDLFDRSALLDFKDTKRIGNCYGFEGFRYYKKNDGLDFNGTCIYKQGKWATRVKGRVKVDHVGVDYSTWSGNVFFGFSFKGSQDIDKSGIGSFLASQLEKYLNGEIE